MNSPSQTVTVLWDAYTYLKELQDNSVVVGHNYWGLDQLLERVHAAALQAQQDGPSDRDAVLQAAMEEIAKEHLKEPQGAEDHSYDLGVTDSYCAVKRMLSKFAPAQPEAGADDARDAARYRYLRSAYPGDVEGYWWGYAASTNSDLSRLDAVIDAAIAKQDATDRREG